LFSNRRLSSPGRSVCGGRHHETAE
jgi:hypothetical protein